MKKSIRQTLLFGFFAMTSLLLFAQCEKANPQPASQTGCNNYCDNPIAQVIADIPGAPLNQGELDALRFMREEEKLARDVYTKLYEKWGLMPFKNIKSSEQTHMDAVSALLVRYNLPDPTVGKDTGEFANADLQNLYNTLLEKGLQTLEDALVVGATIEEVDIVDLQRALDQFVDNEDIRIVFENLIRGSRNHLRAFTGNLKARNIEYQPQYLSPEQYEAIVNGDHEHGVTGG